MKKFLLILAAVFCCTLGVNAQETPDYFCVTFDITGSTVSKTFYLQQQGSGWTTPNLEYSFDGTNWNDIFYGYSAGKIEVNDGAKVYIRAGHGGDAGINETFSLSASNYIQITCPSTLSGQTVSVAVSGNIMSLLDGQNFETLDEVPQYAFYKLFTGSNYTSFTDVANLRLPATKLANSCYAYMFYKCSGITSAPALPATELAPSCYTYMFNSCTSLLDAPILPATTLVEHCYEYMFASCSSLRSIEVKFTKWPQTVSQYESDSDYKGTYMWVSSVSQTDGEFTCPEDLPHEVPTYFGASKIPTGWTVEHPTNYIIINDNEAYTGVKDKTATVTYNRTFATANLWEPLYVPFSINITADLLSKCDIADIYMVSKGSGVYSGKDVTVVRKMSAEETTIAHTPYFIRAKASGDFTFTQENTLVKAAPQTPSIIDCSTTKDKYEFIGSYSGETLNPTDGDFYILDAEGALTKISEETTLPFNRWYMKKTSRQIQPIGANLAPSMPILTIGEDDTTGIIGLDEVKTNANDKLYNMMGVAVEAGRASLPAGVYLQQGKKFIVK